MCVVCSCFFFIIIILVLLLFPPSPNLTKELVKKEPHGHITGPRVPLVRRE